MYLLEDMERETLPGKSTNKVMKCSLNFRKETYPTAGGKLFDQAQDSTDPGWMFLVQLAETPFPNVNR